MSGRSVIAIESLKHDGSIHRVWRTNDILYRDENVWIGMNNRTTVIESNGKKWRTEEPALLYFHRHHWFNIILLFGDSDYYYCNLASPFTYANNTLSYIDYDIDIVVDAHGLYEIMDEDEFQTHQTKYGYDQWLIQKVEKQKKVLIEWIEQRKGPFHPSFKDFWYKEIEKGRLME